MKQSTSNSAIVSNLSTYKWEIPGKPVAIHLRLEVIDRMSPEILRGLGALKRRGAEVGGLLLGRSEPGSPRQVWIEDFEPVPSEYLTGPSYRLSENDLVALETSMSKRRAHGDGRLSVVGLYRSHTRDELFMDDDDLAVARRYFPDPGSIFLIVKPFMMRPSIGGFFIWEDGEIFRQSSYQQFPFSRKELGGGESKPPRPARSATPPQAPAEPWPADPPRANLPQVEPPQVNPPQAEPPQAEPKAVSSPRPAPQPISGPLIAGPPSVNENSASARQYSGLSILSADEFDSAPAESASSPASRRWVPIAAFICLAGAGGYFGYRGLTQTRTEAPAAASGAAAVLPLKLAVEEKGDQLDVTWDRNAPSVKAANRGLLNISDGAATRDLELSSAQLHSGSVLYSKLSGDVMLRLEVYPEGQDPVSESIRVLSSDPAPRPKVPEARLPPPAAQPSAATETPAPPSSRKTASSPKVERRAAARPTSTARRKQAPTPVEAPPAQPPPQPEIELQRPERRR